MIVTSEDVRSSVQQLLRDQLTPVLGALATDRGLALPPIVSWQRLPDFALIAETQSPALLITAPGIVGVPDQHPGVQPVARWAVRVFVVVRGRTYEETAARTAYYVAAVRTVLLSNRRLLGLASAVEWTAESYAELASGADSQGSARTVGAGTVTVTYDGIPTDTAI